MVIEPGGDHDHNRAANSRPRPYYTAVVSSDGTIAGFLERARVEAERYGLDPWVFVRELLQNARDAGARRVWIAVDTDQGCDRISCRDDGEGMTLDHARRYLFTLYASNKREAEGAAGRFGVGFWSVLRFRPEEIIVRSRPPDGEGWEVCLDGSLTTASSTACVMLPGTEIVLRRPAIDGGVERDVLGAVRQDARYLRRRDDPEQPLEVSVNGTPTHAPIELPPPSVSFRGREVRGAVGLAAEPSVEIFAHGLRVRTATLLDDLLLSGDEPDAARAPLPDGLVPRVVIDSDRLRVLLARGDAVEDRALRATVEIARSELRRLIGSILDRRAPRGWAVRLLEPLRELWGRSWMTRIGAATLVGGGLGIALALLVGSSLRSRDADDPAGIPQAVERAAVPAAELPIERSYRDLADSYAGPSVDPIDHRWSAALRYRPAAERPFFGALRITGIGPDGGPRTWSDVSDLAPYRGQACRSGCLEVEIGVSATAGPLRLPVPTGHLIDPRGVVFDGEPVEVLESPAGEPVMLLDRSRSGRLQFRCGPGPATARNPAGSWPPLPAALRDAVRKLQRTPRDLRAEEAVDSIRSLITYDTSRVVVDQHRLARRRGVALFERALTIGAGDCDVQNAALAALLEASGVPARLAVGFVGVNGRASPGLHAWVEYLEDDRWRIADASSPEATSPPVTTVAPAAVDDDSAAEHVVRAPAPAARHRVERPAIVLIVAAVAFGGAGGALLLISSRRRRAIHGDAEADLASLLRGVLLRPEAFGDVPSVLARRLVPTHGRRAISVGRAQRLARRGRLFRSDGATPLAVGASRRGVVVIDASTGEGRVVADLLGARDLDGWDGLLDRAEATEATGLLEDSLRRIGERWRVRAAADAPDAVASMEGWPLGYGRGSGAVVVDTSSGLWRTIAAAEGRPAWSALVLGEAISGVLDLDPIRRRRLLSVLARRAVLEGAA